jgi:hypothetical protein
MWETSVRKLPKVNNHPSGENSPNLVTLVVQAKPELRTA